jgi:hypothetical protein
MYRRRRSLIGNISGPSKQCGGLDKGFGNGKQRPRLLLVDRGRKGRTKAGFVSDRTEYISLYQIACSF